MTTQPPPPNPPIAFQRPHWIEVASAALPLVVVSLVAACLAAPALLKTVLLLPPCAFLIRAVATFLSTSVTLHRGELELKSGIIQRATIGFPISRIESVEMRQSIIGRALNYGALIIRTVGGDSVATINLRAPEVIRKQIYWLFAF
ncbi:PH domain-containing protein, partial [Pseudomonas veronii]|uniref:PH domain-containing protein n=1 Tax=Pseudomonas veronii TaxID=76761 RepID=UPI0015A19414